MQFEDMNKNLVANIKKVAEINSNMVVGLVKQQMEVVEICTESSTKQLKVMSDVKQLKDVFAVQSGLFQEVSKKLMNNFRVSTEIVVDAKNQLVALSEQALKEVSLVKAA